MGDGEGNIVPFPGATQATACLLYTSPFLTHIENLTKPVITTRVIYAYA